ncbi:MAG: hypothetical protein HON90_11255 [Halobacteriovoraceae bacterium]|jgi:hypothetical protein|nr:hypothetical protein [Halobacteriovoraceae bacterium]
MAIETAKDFLARGGKVSKLRDNDISLEELLKKEGLINDKGAKAIADLLSSKISESLDSELKTKEE